MFTLTALALTMAQLLAASSTPATDRSLPDFLVMYGLWESVAVRAEPADIFVQMPHLQVAHEIRGRPSAVCPGIAFEVEQQVDGNTMRTELNYAYDVSSSKSFGILHSSDGSVLQGVIHHSPEADSLTLTNTNDDVVWSESKVWQSPDEFHSEATFPFDGGTGRVWFVTRRVGSKPADVPGHCGSN